jgi:phospholipase/lecithinase/hemolysin
MIKRIAKFRFSFVLVASVLLAAEISAAHATAFSRIIVFGDSLSDTGNFFALTGGVRSPPPYFEGRFCNGPIWVEYLADDLGMSFNTEDNYAVGGALTGSDNFNDGFLGLQYPGVQDEITTFLQKNSGHADPDALYVVSAGANDFFAVLTGGGDPAALIANGVANTAQAIQRLAMAGAQHIAVPNIPDIGVTPEAQSSGAAAAITQLCSTYDQFLTGGLQSLEAAGVRTIQIDAFTVLQEMAGEPEDFGFTNVGDPLLGVLIAGGNANPNEYLFWDTAHPTTRAHEVLARAAADRIMDFYSPSQGKGTPPAQVHALNGLAKAAGK